MFFNMKPHACFLRYCALIDAPQVLDFTIGIKSFSKCMKLTACRTFICEAPAEGAQIRIQYGCQITAFQILCFQKENPCRIIGTVCIHNIAPAFTEAVKLAINFPASFTTWGMPLRQSASAPSLPLMSFACTR